MAMVMDIRGDASSDFLLQLQQLAFAVETPGVSSEVAASTDNAVAGNDDGDGVSSHCTTNSLRRADTETSGQLAVSHRLAIGNGLQPRPHALQKGRTTQRHQRRAVWLIAGEISIQPAACLVKNWQFRRYGCLRPESAAEVLLSVKPKTNKHRAIAAQRNTSKRRVIMCRVVHLI